MNTKEMDKIFKGLSLMHPEARCELNHKTPFELLVAVILSAQCTDIRVNMITDKLFKVYNTPYQFAELTLQELKPYIYSCGFYNNKGKNIISMSKALVKKHNGKVPDTMEELTALDGVGRKTASVVLSVAFNKPAMPVDTHVFRVSRRLGIARSSTADGVEKELMNIIEKNNWHDFHHYLIFHGRYICKARKPECHRCNLTDYCDFYKQRIEEDGK
ncbi:MAG: endonuclease III [Bacillota bacterium]|jgi:endonuclease-3|nr:endonuclease III [Bacillota bacterium]HHU43590.1 endonuclease III [Clostridiales bacterium]